MNVRRAGRGCSSASFSAPSKVAHETPKTQQVATQAAVAAKIAAAAQQRVTPPLLVSMGRGPLQLPRECSYSRTAHPLP